MKGFLLGHKFYSLKEEKMKKWTFVFLLSLIALMTLALPVAAKTTRTEFSGVSNGGPVMGAREWTSDDGILHARDGWIAGFTDVNDDRYTGEELVTVNYNFHPAPPPVYICGPMWGKVRLTNENGYWEGTWVGERTALEGFVYLRAVLRGHGDYEGLQARVDYIRLSPDPTAPYQVTGFIMSPGGK